MEKPNIIDIKKITKDSFVDISVDVGNLPRHKIKECLEEVSNDFKEKYPGVICFVHTSTVKIKAIPKSKRLIFSVDVKNLTREQAQEYIDVVKETVIENIGEGHIIVPSSIQVKSTI